MQNCLKSIALGIVPAGSGNGVAASISSGDPFTATLNIVAGKPQAVDLFSVQHKGQNKGTFQSERIWDIHFFCWGAFADHDHLLENTLRSLGPVVKMILAPIWVILLNKHYKAKVQILPAPYTGQMEAQGYDSAETLEKSTMAATSEGCSSKLGEWRHLDGHFFGLAMGNLSCGSIDLKPTPHVHHCEGAVDMLVERQRPPWPRLTYARLFLQCETGEHVHSPYVEMFKVKAALVEPLGRVGHRSECGYMQCSGEDIGADVKLLECHQGFAQVIMAK